MQNQSAEQVVKALKEANNVLVTVKNGPSVDELTAAIGLTLMLNHMGKHAITVFSGRVPSTLEFLQPEMAIDTNTDSLRDFIIALDKSKADKLRYKVEDNVVRIFITPYKTSISERDLEFSQGDFNVDVVVALGVVTKEDFDQAVTAHGRILHDATVLALTKQNIVSQIGALNWQEQQASSISEMIASITDALGENVLDGQIATALMTGIVAETDRFRNQNTTPQVLSISAKLMAAGANQQLIAEKLEEPDMGNIAMPLREDDASSGDDGALEIDHDEDVQNIHIDESGNLAIPAQESVDAVSDLPVQQQDDADTRQEPHFDDQAASSRSYIAPTQAPQMFGQEDGGVVTAQPLLSQPMNAAVVQTSDKATRKVIEPLHGADELREESNYTQPEPPMPTMDILLDQARSDVPVAAAPSTPQSQQSVSVVSAPEPIVVPPPQASSSEQTLSDLEQAVKAAPASGDNESIVAAPVVEAPKVEDFLGTTRQSAPVADPVSDITPASPVVQPDEQETEEKADEDDDLIQPPPEIIDPTAPPEVPPPLLAQAPTQPQFFDADGKSSNPFLNPNQ